MGKEEEGVRKGTQIEDSWARTMEGLTVGVGGDGIGVSNGKKAGQH